jgi:prephenate dehydratase
LKRKIAFPGERGSFTELAAIEYFGKDDEYCCVPEFSEVFEAVQNGTCKYGVVPIENSTAGSIHQNFDSLLESQLHITGEIMLRIGQCLVANKGVKRKNITKVYSHPAAFAQCKNFLRKNPGLSKITIANTALAVKKINDEQLKDGAAIASMQAAIDFDMNVLAQNIEDNKWNTTRFIIVCKKAEKPSGAPVKTSIVFSTKNIPGALFKCLGVFALRDIDLYKIESRPVHGQGFSYLFYLDFSGDIRDEAQKNALNHLQEITTFFRHLGSYTCGKLVQPHYHKRS